MYVGHVCVEFLIQELTHIHYATVEAEVRSSSVSVVYVVHLHMVFLKAALHKRGSMEPVEPPLDPPLNSAHRPVILQAQVVRRAWVGDYDTLPQFSSIAKI